MASFVPYDFQGPFPDDFLTHIKGDQIKDGKPGWTVDYTDSNDNGYADFVDAYNDDPDLYVRASQDHAGDAGFVSVELGN